MEVPPFSGMSVVSLHRFATYGVVFLLRLPFLGLFLWETTGNQPFLLICETNQQKETNQKETKGNEPLGFFLSFGFLSFFLFLGNQPFLLIPFCGTNPYGPDALGRRTPAQLRGPRPS